MKKILFYVFIIITLTSCTCPYCHEYPCICDCEYKQSITKGGSSDYFSAATLVGEWQMVGYHDNEYMNGCGIIPKGIIFAKQEDGEFGRCTMTYSVDKNPQWYQMDLEYNYVRRELTFYRINSVGKLEKFISFTYRGFLFPTLTIEDSFGRYEWNKVRVATPK